MKKTRLIKNTQHYRFINYIPEPRRKSIGGFKDKTINPFKANPPKQVGYVRGTKLSKPKTQNIRNPFVLNKKNN